MRKKALGLGDMSIPGLDYDNRTGLTDNELEKYDRFFGGKDLSETNTDVLPTTFKTSEHPEDRAYEDDEKAKQYFDYLFNRVKEKERTNKKS